MENGYYNSSWPEAEKTLADFSATPSNESCLVVPWPMGSHFSGYKCHGHPSTIEGVAEDKAITASGSHSQDEKRRRDRINAQLSALRQLIPESEKSFIGKDNYEIPELVLGSAIDQVKDLKRKVKELSKYFNLPTEIDEVTVVDCKFGDEDMMSNEKRFIKASICCDDRPKVLPELIRVLKGLKLSTIKSDISSVGGRLKSNFILCSEDEGVSPNTLEHSLNVVLSRNASSSLGSDCHIRSKRQRLLLPSMFT